MYYKINKTKCNFIEKLWDTFPMDGIISWSLPINLLSGWEKQSDSDQQREVKF